jgi:hypothetical protein
VSRSASEPDSASLRELRAAKLPYERKPATGGEGRGESSHWALRGGWGRRVGTDQSRNLGDPAEWTAEAGQRLRGMHNLEAARSGVGPAHSSEEAGNDRGAKGPEQRHAE